MLDAITFDLDSTIADTRHRQHMVTDPKTADWEAYSMACADDTPIEGTVVLMRTLYEADRHRIAIITGRSDAARDLTRAWLCKHDVRYDYLLMRRSGDRTPNGEFKVAVIERLRRFNRNVVLHVDDYPKAADYITEHTGIPVLLVAERQIEKGMGSV